MEAVVIAIDGPAGAGKSTAARLLAERLQFDFLDTGAMYRCATLAVMRSGIPIQHELAVAELVGSLDIRLDGTRVWLNGENVSSAIRQPDVTAAIGPVADNALVRNLLSGLQRAWVRNRRVVTEGRDQGSVVFPDACCKIFLTASSAERARRRVDELRAKGTEVSFEAILQQQNERDREDVARPHGGLLKTPDAIELLTDGLSLEQVVDRLVAIAEPCIERSLTK